MRFLSFDIAIAFRVKEENPATMDGQSQDIRSEFTQAPLDPRTPLRPLPHLAAKPLRPIGKTGKK
jgi:hypothetical protein